LRTKGVGPVKQKFIEDAVDGIKEMENQLLRIPQMESYDTIPFQKWD